MRSSVVAGIAGDTIACLMCLDAGREVGVDLPRHQDHFAGGFFFGFSVACEIALHMAARTGNAEGGPKHTHGGADFFGLQNL